MTQLPRARTVRPVLRTVCVTGVALAALLGLATPAGADVAGANATDGRTSTGILHPATPRSSAPATPAGRTGRTGLTGLTGPVRYAVNKPLCAAASSPTAYTCLAMRRVPVKAGTPGAYAYSVPAFKHGPSGGLTPADLAKAYGYDPDVHRKGQTVAVVNWYDDPQARTDLNTFDRHYGFPKETSRSFRKVNQSGHAKGYPRKDRSSAGEISLDIETVRAVCRSCRILLVEAKGPTSAALSTAENTAARLGATEISNSFGGPEHTVPARMRKAFDHPGIVITASTGDDGWYDWDAVNAGAKSPGRASYPSTDPHVVAVGGTTLRLTSHGTRKSETVWNGNGSSDTLGVQEGPLGASGGGCSKKFPAGAWQRKHAGYAAAKCGSKRLAADVSADADPATGFDVINTYHERGLSKWETVGGTSLSSPLVAAMYALAGGAHGSAYPAASLYLNATHRRSSVHDVTKGGNSLCGGGATSTCSQTVLTETDPPTNNPNAFGDGITDCSFPRTSKMVTSAPAKNPECNATVGYDGASGLGSPTGLSFFHPTAPRLSIKHRKHVRVHHSVAFTARAIARVKGLRVTSYSWKFGDGKSSSRSSPREHHTFKKKGTYQLVLRVADTSGQIAVARFQVRVS